MKKQKSIDEQLKNLIEETVKATLQRKALQEKEKQEASAQATKQSSAPATSAQPSSSDDDESSSLKTGDVKIEDVIEKLNSIRSGKSFKDENVSQAFDKYFGELDKAEKTALFAFLKGIAQILTGEVSGSSVLDPGESPASVEMEKKVGPTRVSIKPNVIKAPDIEKKKSKSVEDTTGPVPIAPKTK